MPSPNAPAAAGRLRIALNMGNPILTGSVAQTERPAGLAPDLGRALAARLGKEPEFLEFQTAAQCLAELGQGHADLSFMAVDPARAQDVHFSSPYVLISGAFAVRRNSPLHSNADVDQAGHQVVVGKGSAYDLFLTRYLKQASLHRIALSEQVVEEMLNADLPVAAGIRQQLETLVADRPDVRILDEDFMVIQQSVALAPDVAAETRQNVEDFLTWARTSGFIEDAMARHGVAGARVAPEPSPANAG